MTKCVPVWFQRQDWIFVVEFLGKENEEEEEAIILVQVDAT